MSGRSKRPRSESCADLEPASSGSFSRSRRAGWPAGDRDRMHALTIVRLAGRAADPMRRLRRLFPGLLLPHDLIGSLPYVLAVVDFPAELLGRIPDKRETVRNRTEYPVARLDALWLICDGGDEATACHVHRDDRMPEHGQSYFNRHRNRPGHLRQSAGRTFACALSALRS